MTWLRELLEASSAAMGEITSRQRLLWQTQPRKLLLWYCTAAPVILVAISTFLTAILLIGPGGRAINWYEQQAMLAMARQDPDTARLCYSGLLQRDPDNPKYQFGLAMSLLGLKQNSAAMLLVNRLSPDAPGSYAPAHVFVAQQILSAPSPTAEQLRTAEWHLLRAVQSDPSDPKTHALLAAVYSKTGRWELVKQHLPLAGDAVDEMGLIAAQSFAAQGDAAEADAWARRAAKLYHNRCLANPHDYDARLKWAQAQLYLRDYAAALETVESGWADFKQPAFRRAAAQVCLAWCQSASLTPSRRLAMVQRGLSWDSTNAGLLLQLTDSSITDLATSLAPATQPSETALLQLLCQAIAASRTGSDSDIHQTLNRALAFAGPDAITMTANVACLWAYSSRTDAPSALNLSSTLSDLRPDNPIAQRAQGLVLAKQGRFNRASTYLEQALKAMPNDPAMHGVLANCYQEMGMPEEAAVQRRLAQAATQPATTQPASH